MSTSAEKYRERQRELHRIAARAGAKWGAITSLALSAVIWLLR
jgi:hypothetical protein